ncbi:MAG TPA: hypothetical protein VHM67_09585 [Gemmatimonadaceae bacterium]|nr:hypothetical protein [Gemmatimonadaceae bacterium]
MSAPASFVAETFAARTFHELPSERFGRSFVQITTRSVVYSR